MSASGKITGRFLIVLITSFLGYACGGDGAGGGGAADGALDGGDADIIALDAGNDGEEGGDSADGADAGGDAPATFDADAGDGGADAGELWAPSSGVLAPVVQSCADGEPDAPTPIPEEFWGEEGLGSVGWTAAELSNAYAWNVGTEFALPWIASPSAESPGVRVQPERAPQAAACYLRYPKAYFGGNAMDIAALLAGITPFLDAAHTLGALETVSYTPSPPPTLAGNPLAAAVRGLWSVDNPLRDESDSLPERPADAAIEEFAARALAALGPDTIAALADAVVALGEAALLMDSAMAAAPRESWRAIFDAYHSATYGPAPNGTWAFMTPLAAVEPTLEVADLLQRAWLLAATQRVASAGTALADSLEQNAMASEERIEVDTPFGRIVLDLDGEDDDWAAGALEDAALVVDAGGNDAYRGRVASTTRFWMGGAILVDVSGDDVYGPDVPDIAQPEVDAHEALAPEHALTQGFGLFGVAVLIDSGGDDRYSASAHAQGGGAFGAGLLIDRAGADIYRSALLGQGVGTFGLGVLVDVQGDDDYALYAVGQGAGRPGGHGLLLDGQGNDDYLALYDDDPPELPAPGYPNVYGATSGYSDSLGENHYINAAQGVGWGYRFDWNQPQVNWGGGFGALVDLGDGADTHYADCLSIGQGFVYGLGLFYDEGGDDLYRAFWWAYGSGTHMGTGIFWEGGGDDDYLATRASATLGHDTGVAWFFEESGDDVYAEALNFGYSLTNGLAFFFDLDGSDLYAPPLGQQQNAEYSSFGAVHDAAAGIPRIGVFMDLGGKEDTYLTIRPEIGNGKGWNLPPTGPQADPAIHKGVGLDQ